LAADDGDFDEAALRRGVDRAMACGNLLTAALSVRTLALFDSLTPQAGNSYLSGLLIGEELRARRLDAADQPPVLVGAAGLVWRYGVALRHLGLSFDTVGQEASWAGLSAIARELEECE